MPQLNYPEYEMIVINDGSLERHAGRAEVRVLPGLDGWEATKRIKSQPETRHIPVVALSAHAMTGDREKALAAGCDDFHTKPVEMSRLLSKVRALLSKESP
jgi:CheY-like chemotaxis protein